MTPAELFTRCGHALCGDGPKWKEQFATLLGIKTNSVDNMAKGTSRIPNGLWVEISGHVLARAGELAGLKRALEEAHFEAWQEETKLPRAAKVWRDKEEDHGG